MRRALKLKQIDTCVSVCVYGHIYKCRLLKKCRILLHSPSTAPVSLLECGEVCRPKCWLGPTNCFRHSGLVIILYIHPILRLEGECLAQRQGFLQGDSFAEGRNYLQVQLKMKFPVGRVGMSHCGSESRGGIFPSLQQGFTSRSALGSGVCHSCPCYWENKGLFRRCNTLDESPPWSQEWGANHGSPDPSCYSPQHPFTELCGFFVPVPTGISCVFPLLAIHGVFLSPSSQVSPGRGGRLWMLVTALEPGGLQSPPPLMKRFLLHFRCQIRLENHVYVKVLNVPVPFLLKSSKPVIILKLKCWWRVLESCQECSPVAP